MGRLGHEYSETGGYSDGQPPGIPRSNFCGYGTNSTVSGIPAGFEAEFGKTRIYYSSSNASNCAGAELQLAHLEAQ
jgi:hypothetical protein